MLESPGMLPARPDIRDRVSFAIKVDFVRGVGDPSRPFRTMVSLMDALNRFDRELVRSVDLSIEPLLLLEDIEASSIKSWVATVLRSTDDTAMRSGDWKKVVGDYLVKAKYTLLEKLDDVTTISQPRLLETIQRELLLEAERTDVRGLLGYTAMPRTALAAHIADITASMDYLQDGDSVTYESRDGQAVRFNTKLRVNSDEIAELLASRVVKNKNEMILKVKKPDFIGSSMWEFQYGGHAIDAKILDDDWLAMFRRDGLGVRPGSALRAAVEVEVPYDDDNEPLPPKYTILRVYEVLPPGPASVQLRLESDIPIVDLDTTRRIKDLDG
jgi:hypothetical protein